MFNCPDLSGCKKFTICFWAKIEDDANITTNWQDIIGFTEQKSDNSSTGQLRAESCYSTAYAETNSNRYIHWHDNTNYAISDFTVYHTTNGETQRNVWHHCVLAVDSDNGIWGYTDGIPVATNGGTVMNGGHLTGQFWLGETGYIQGVINDVRVYKDQILSPREIKEIAKGLVCHYTLAGVGENILTNTKNFVCVSTNNGTTTDDYNGFIIRHLAPRTGTSYREVCAYNGFVPVVSGGSYTQSFWAKGSGYLTVHFYSGNIACATNTSSTGITNTTLDGNVRIYLTSEWKRYWVTHTLKTSSDTPTNKSILLRLWDENGENEVYVCGWKLEKGSVATPWTPNPSDPEYTKMGFDDGIEYDVSGYKYNGTKIGTIIYDVDTPRYWTSSVFDGNTSLIKISDLNLHPMLGSEWTCSFWVYNNDSGGRSIFFSGYGFTTGASFGIEKTTGNATRIYWAGTPDIVPSGYTVPVNQWCHLAFVGTPTSIKCYLNGELKYTYTGTLDVNKLVANTTYGIGRDNRTGATAFNGKMSDVRFYATCLSDADILALYNTLISLSSNGTLMTQGEFTEV